MVKNCKQLIYVCIFHHVNHRMGYRLENKICKIEVNVFYEPQYLESMQFMHGCDGTVYNYDTLTQEKCFLIPRYILDSLTTDILKMESVENHYFKC